MTMNAAQQATWHEIIEAYNEWNAGDNGLMPVSELRENVSASSDQIGDALAQASSDMLAEVGNIGEGPTFRPIWKDANGHA
ncbi:MAG: hypothetical protein JWR25_2138 [Noviherbaspirillum sp.]|jgi:hypothetical protein|nr:hypothetical protein [Noviherbaspirillum sp.]